MRGTARTGPRADRAPARQPGQRGAELHRWLFPRVLLLLSSAAADGIDPEPILARQPLAAGIWLHVIDAVLAAHAGFCLSGTLAPAPPGLAPIIEAKLGLARATIGWLARRVSGRPAGRGAPSPPADCCPDT